MDGRVRSDRPAESEGAWSRDLAERAPGPRDAGALEATGAARALVVTLSGGAVSKALVSAWFSLGLELVRAGASPTLVAAHAVGAGSFAELGALLEGAQEGHREAAARRAREAWSPERCVVLVDDGLATVVLPPDDALDDRASADDALVAHAERLAARLLVRGARRVKLAGGGRAREVARAVLEAEGLTVEPGPGASGGPPPPGAAAGLFARLVAPFSRPRRAAR